MRIPKSAALCVCAAAGLAAIGSGAVSVASAYKTITVQDEGHRKVIQGFSTGTLAHFLQEHGIQVSSRDRVTPGLNAKVRNGMLVRIERPVQVDVVDGAAHPRRVYTFARRVGQLLREQRIRLRRFDQVNLPPSAPLTSGQVVRIRRITHRMQTKLVKIPFQTERQRTDRLYAGQTRVLSHGVQGLLQVRTTSVFVNGHLARRRVVRRVVRPPVAALIEVGSRPRPATLASRGDGPLDVLRQLTVVATAYPAGGRTATGWRALPGVIAVDPDVIPLGSKVYIPGFGIVRAEDTGGAIVGNRIDVCVADEAAARAWGVRVITVYVVR